ncbi:methyl-accepting chemotaxis protein [Pseudoduganella sp. CY13W]|uniref:Methyl-accepting chemotaxis protein n=2 Tax=Duganella qianjiadongensis TaxID=2692176 RepID=A0ABW9VMB5_9BURK|nr:type IV pili methyl-accepting chemotaxis transducer N-terminal domain-containing protein [Duganella qianjiadongensis]MYM40571.1 methyl-accepting chemotaxis protein [Duganella qianjiadongensis]
MGAPDYAAALAAKSARPLSGEVFGAMINLSGRRRFTSQRIVLYALLALQGEEASLAVAREALGLFRKAHFALLEEADGLPGVFCPELYKAYFGQDEGDRKIRDFADLAERTLRAIEAGAVEAQALQAELVQQTTPTLAVLNHITGIYEEQSRLHARQMKRQLRSVISDIETINREARMVAFNARIVAARAGRAGVEFSVVAGVMSNISGEIDQMIATALAAAE